MTNERSFELGIGTFAWAGGAPDVDSVQYYHGDQIGTTRLMTTRGAAPIQSSAYTAFGERTCDLVGRSCGPSDPNHRYGYAGAWGYQAASSDDPSDPYLDFPFLHVGWRYYDPSTGRFPQRDPIGIRGGLNVYEYVNSRPTVEIDPIGLKPRRGAGDILEDSGGGHGDETWALACQILWACGSCACMGEPGYPPGCPEREGHVPDRNPFTDFWNWFSSTPPGWTSGACFVGRTPVETPSGPINVEDLEKQMCVLSQGSSGGEGCARVVDVFEAWTTRLVYLELGDETITCTPEHPFWVVGEGWVRAADLDAGCRLLGSDGRGILVTDVVSERHSNPVLVYNITVDGEHTYYVGKSRVLVHNKQ